MRPGRLGPGDPAAGRVRAGRGRRRHQSPRWDGEEVRCGFKAWAQPVGSRSRGLRYLHGTGLGLSRGPPVHPPARGRTVEVGS